MHRYIKQTWSLLLQTYDTVLDDGLLTTKPLLHSSVKEVYLTDDKAGQ